MDKVMYGQNRTFRTLFKMISNFNSQEFVEMCTFTIIVS
jgi:hypothetical protein